MPRPCSGLTVLDLSRGIAGPLAARLLADCGASVLRIVRPGTERRAEHPASLPWQFGKAVQALDLKTPAGQNALRRLAAGADVLIESFRPGRMEAWGLGYDILADSNPRLIYCAISGYGPDGPLAGQPGYEGPVQAYSFIAGGQTGFRPGPTPVAVPVASVEAGLQAAAGILAALLARERGLGRGQRVDTSLLAGAMAMETCVLVGSEGLAPREQPQDPLGATPGYKLYECGDGGWIHVACLTGDFFQRLLVALDRTEILLDPRFAQAPNYYASTDDRRALIAILGARFRERPAAEWLEILEAADVPCAPVRAAEDLWQDPQAAHQRVIVEEDDADLGRVRRVGPLFTLSPLGTATSDSVPAVTPALAADEPPLRGLRVLDASAYIAGPYGTRILADLGAEILKLEPLEGEAFRYTGNVFLALNHGKRSIAVDLKTAEGQALARQLAGTCDAVLHNLRPGVAERIGLGAADLAARYPHLVYTQVSAFGPDGPYAHRPGYDPLGQALAGIEHAQGGAGNPPSFLRVAACDIAVATTAAVATLAGLLGRQRFGDGALLQTSLLRAGAALTAEWSLAYAGRPPARRLDARQYGTSPFNRLYQTTDGWLFLTVPANRWPALRTALRLTSPPADGPHDPDALLEPALAQLPTAAACARLTGAGAAAMPVSFDYIETFREDPQAQIQGLAVHCRHPAYGRFDFVGPAVRLSATPARPGRHAPALGEHTEETLAGLGLDAPARAALRERRIVGWGHDWPSA